MAGLERSGRRHHQAGEQAFLEAFAVDAEIGRLADADVVPRRAFDARELPRPDMRRFIGLELEAALLDLLDRVGCRRLDPVDLAGEQSCGAGVGLRHRQQHHLVDLGHARLVPIAVVLDQFEPLARRELRHLPGAGARGVPGERRPGGLRFCLGVGAFSLVIKRLPLGRAGHEQVGQVDRQEAVRLLGGQFHGQRRRSCGQRPASACARR